jgi:hypothetical protein
MGTRSVRSGARHRRVRFYGHVVGVIFDYFTAPDDDAAAEVIDEAGDLGTRSPTAADAGVDPVVQLGTLGPSTSSESCLFSHLCSISM